MRSCSLKSYKMWILSKMKKELKDNRLTRMMGIDEVLDN